MKPAGPYEENVIFPDAYACHSVGHRPLTVLFFFHV